MSNSSPTQASNISNICILCCSNVGKHGAAYRGRRCANSNRTLQQQLRNYDENFYRSLMPFLVVRELHVCSICCNKLNKIENKLNHIDKLKGQLGEDREDLFKKNLPFREKYLNVGIGLRVKTPQKLASESTWRRPLQAVQQPQASYTSGSFTPRRSSKIPRRSGFSPFTSTASSSSKKNQPSPSRIPVRRKTPRSKSSAKQLFAQEQEESMDAEEIGVVGLSELDKNQAVNLDKTTFPSVTSLHKPPSSKEIHSLAKVTVKFGQTERTRFLSQSDIFAVSICRGIVKGDKDGMSQLANAVYSKPELSNMLKNKMEQQINTECLNLCSTSNPTMLRDTSPAHLNNFDAVTILKEWKDRAPCWYSLLVRILQCSPEEPAELNKKTSLRILAAGSALLFNRCQQMSAFHHAMGLLLDFGGAKNKTIDVFSKCGYSVSTGTVYNQRKALEKHHDGSIYEALMKKKKNKVLAVVSSIPCLQLPLYACNSSSLYIIRHMLQLGIFAKDPLKIPTNICWDIFGDNLDFRIKPFHQTMTKRGEDIHWFLLVGAAHRVVPPLNLDHLRPRRDIREVSNIEFLPELEDHKSLTNNFVFHVLEVLTQYIPFLKNFSQFVPTHIPHAHVKEMAKQSTYVLLDVLNKNENKNDDMIDILDHVHQNYVPFIPEALGENVLERFVFGGDQLTNERAYSAQLNMANGTTESSKLLGILHRTEGLHLCMNTCLYILETFYSTTSIRDCGTLYHLKALVDRRNISLDMTTGYNQAKNLIDDILDAHIVASALDYFGMKEVEDSPFKNDPELNRVEPDNTLCALLKLAQNITYIYILSGEQPTFRDELQKIGEARPVCPAGASKKFTCSVTECTKSFSTIGWLRRHLKNKHGIVVAAVTAAKRTENDGNYDGQNNYATSFMKVALLFRDLRDAFKMGDGDRLFRNFKFLFLHFDQSTHVKYRLWLWRMLAYDAALLSEYERYLYRWNMSVNVTGGVRQCIPNDNLVEIHVHKVKEIIRSMGANVSYAAVRRACKCLGTVKSLEERFGDYVSGRHGDFTSHKVADIKAMASALVNNGNLNHQPTREHANFPNFANSLLKSLDLKRLNDWLQEQKARAAREMVM